jgi:hypothetical protein
LPAKAPRWDHVQTVFDLSPRVREEISAFLIDVTAFEDKHAAVLDWRGPSAAFALIKEFERD